MAWRKTKRIPDAVLVSPTKLRSVLLNSKFHPENLRETDPEKFFEDGHLPAKGAENQPQQTIDPNEGKLFLPNFCSQIFWSFNWRPCCFLVHLEITHFEQVKRLPPLPTFPMWLDQWSKIHSPCHPRCRAILRCINSTKPPQPTFVLEEETNPPTEKKEVKKTQWLSQVISQDIFTTWCGIYDHRLEKKNRTLYTFLFVFCPKKVAKLPSDEIRDQTFIPFFGSRKLPQGGFFPQRPRDCHSFYHSARRKKSRGKAFVVLCLGG